MIKNTKQPKSKRSNEANLLELLRKVLPKAAPDPIVAGKIYEAVEAELLAKSRSASFIKICEKVELPDLEPASIKAVNDQLSASFADGDVTLKPSKRDQTLAVEVSLPNGVHLRSEIKVRPVGAEESGDPEFVPKFIPFPVSLPGDPELIWLLAKTENLSPEEAGIALNKVEEEFWASKTGQRLLRDRVERSFPEFISRAPAGLLRESGLKRHYKTPEPVKILRPLKLAKAKA